MASATGRHGSAAASRWAISASVGVHLVHLLHRGGLGAKRGRRWHDGQLLRVKPFAVAVERVEPAAQLVDLAR